MAVKAAGGHHQPLQEGVDEAAELAQDPLQPKEDARVDRLHKRDVVSKKD